MELVGYFDASGSPNDPNCRILTVAGFAASTEQWRGFEKDWQALLASEGIDCLHMKEFAHSVGAFRHWKRDETRRRRLVAHASQIIGKYANEVFSIAIMLDEYRAADRVYKLSEFCKPYTIAASIVITRAKKSLAETYPDHSLSCVFEKGDVDQDQLVKFLRMDGSEVPLQFLEKSCAPLQAADFLSYEHTKNLSDYMVADRRKVRESLWSLSVATGTVGKKFTVLGYPMFSLMAETFKLPKRDSNVPHKSVIEVASQLRSRREHHP